jgi:Fe-S-cluster containining protein
MLLTKAEADHWAKYYGKEFTEDYWKDVFEVYQGKNILLPVEHTNLNVLRLLKGFKCDKCGECCKYKLVPVNAYDIRRLLDAGLDTDKLEEKAGQAYLISEGGCPMWEDGCSIYSQRPDTCFMFPIQGPVESESDGRKIKQIRVRLKCQASLELTRKIITQTISQGGILLPDLTII